MRRALVGFLSVCAVGACGETTDDVAAPSADPSTHEPEAGEAPGAAPAPVAPKPAALKDGWVRLDRGTKLHVDASRSSAALSLVFDESREEMMYTLTKAKLDELIAASTADDPQRSEHERLLAELKTPEPRRIAAKVIGERDGWVEVETLGSGGSGEAETCPADLDGVDLFRLRFFVDRAAIAEVITADAPSPECAEDEADAAVALRAKRIRQAVDPDGEPVADLQWGARSWGKTKRDAKEWEVAASTPVFWPDGRRAGAVTKAHRYRAAGSVQEARTCFEAKFEGADANTYAPAGLGLCFDTKDVREMPKPENPIFVANAGILGVMSQQSGHFLASPYGGAFAVGNDDDDVWGGLTGTEVGIAYGAGGLGFKGSGRGGGGTGEGRIDFGSGGGKLGKGGVATKAVARVGQVDASGVSETHAKRLLSRASASFRYCYEKSLREDPKLSGTVELSLTLGDDGKVTTVSATGGVDESTRSCVERSARRVKFDGGGTVRAKILFKPG